MNDPAIENIGWTLGNDCPYRCPHCYSTIVRTRGRELTVADVDRIVSELASIGVRTVNLGGNEPIFTNGPDPRNTLLPYIIRSLYEAGIIVGMTTAGISLTLLEKFFPETLTLLNDIDVSLDSPFESEHNTNRGANLYSLAFEALDICASRNIPHTIVMCGMSWNLSDRHLDSLIAIAKREGTFVRINFIKPTEAQHLHLSPDVDSYERACARLLADCDVVEMGESILAGLTDSARKGCPCGTKSFRIHSITPEGKVPVSPCVYAHAYKTGDLLTEPLADIVRSPSFVLFRERRDHPERINGCSECGLLESCRGGCAARAYLHPLLESGEVNFWRRDPYCPRDREPAVRPGAATFMDRNGMILVHQDYLCTLIVRPR